MGRGLRVGYRIRKKYTIVSKHTEHVWKKKKIHLTVAEVAGAFRGHVCLQPHRSARSASWFFIV